MYIIRNSIFFLLLLLFCSIPLRAQELNAAAVRQIIQSGGSIILDMENNTFSTADLISFARALKYNATLTIIVSKTRPLTSSECVHIANSNPGHVVFWLK